MPEYLFSNTIVAALAVCFPDSFLKEQKQNKIMSEQKQPPTTKQQQNRHSHVNHNHTDFFGLIPGGFNPNSAGGLGSGEGYCYPGTHGKVFCPAYPASCPFVTAVGATTFPSGGDIFNTLSPAGNGDASVAPSGAGIHEVDVKVA